MDPSCWSSGTPSGLPAVAPLLIWHSPPSVSGAASSPSPSPPMNPRKSLNKQPSACRTRQLIAPRIKAILGKDAFSKFEKRFWGSFTSSPSCCSVRGIFRLAQAKGDSHMLNHVSHWTSECTEFSAGCACAEIDNLHECTIEAFLSCLIKSCLLEYLLGWMSIFKPPFPFQGSKRVQMEFGFYIGGQGHWKPPPSTPASLVCDERVESWLGSASH